MVKVRRALAAAQDQIESAIGRAEQGTSGELVVVVSKRAGEYGRQESVFAFVIALLALTGFWIGFQRVVVVQPWDASPKIIFGLGWVLLTLVAGYALGQAIAWRFPRIASAMVSKRTLRRQAEEAAAYCFKRYRVSVTDHCTGVLIFIAEVEQTVVVIGDNQVAASITKNQWEDIRDAVLSGIRESDPALGLINGIELAGELLRKHLPSDSDVHNERPNRLYFL